MRLRCGSHHHVWEHHHHQYGTKRERLKNVDRLSGSLEPAEPKATSSSSQPAPPLRRGQWDDKSIKQPINCSLNQSAAVPRWCQRDVADTVWRIDPDSPSPTGDFHCLHRHLTTSHLHTLLISMCVCVRVRVLFSLGAPPPWGCGYFLLVSVSRLKEALRWSSSITNPLESAVYVRWPLPTICSDKLEMIRTFVTHWNLCSYFLAFFKNFIWETKHQPANRVAIAVDNARLWSFFFFSTFSFVF